MRPTELSDAGLQAIRDHEALRLFAYPDPASPLANATPRTRWGFARADQLLAELPMSFQIMSGKPWTIGWGLTRYPDGSPVQPGDACTADQADVWLRVVVAQYVRAVAQAVVAPINQPMFDALVSFAYNVGEHAFRTSTLVKRLNDGQYIEAQAEFDRWVNAGGKVSGGLVNRRNLEQAMFNEGVRLALADSPEALAWFEAYLKESAA